MIRLDEIYDECIELLNSMSAEDMEELMKQARIDSQDSYLLGDLDEDELEKTDYINTEIEKIHAKNQNSGWSVGMWDSFVLDYPHANGVYMDGGWAA